ncbi:prepilin peptidase [Paraburkholderia sp. 22099]|jgi:leader peptidase (prepilin peptidase) / N-methyltransferase|uniref:Prepilin leader peptidase/N-methyltransferase n=1 Tax=Paraburkholderia terricola TaxID=169427 RepID=A0A1M6UQE1_9BURK|nr:MULTISPECIES: A24 family peptidase [Paraburkholderia]AXE93625.1 prepilin peptidase [Paraburkholderia terricola]ORC45137.1 prepilin peptidase [Burkholderia sp. A27]SDO97803.1 leader peptidase (prepilin peptidase) / N-methyltransferase [Paraburkholderia sediminicola]SHK71442.1 leader peptidase (prepilin peptidase) / N-methyltransferase [Paraburkholderia terricola]
MQATLPLVPETSSSLLSSLLPGHVATGLGLAFGSLPAGVQFTFAIVFGLVIGSFLNVVVHRVPIMLERAWREEISEATDKPVEQDGLPARYNLWVPRSACPHCGHVLSAWENLPVLSYVLLRGRCSACKARVSLRYPAIEIASAALAAGALALFGPTGTALAAFGLCAALLAMSAIDIDTHLLPDSMTLPLLWAGLIVNFNGMFASLHDAVLGAIFGYLVLWAVHWLFRLVRGVEGMGYGDFKLLAALGAWLGWAALLQIVLIAALTGAVVGLAATWRGRMRFAEPLPFGPFLAAGGAVTLFVGTPLFMVLGG